MDKHFRAESRFTAHAVILDLYGDLSNQSEECLLSLNDWERGLQDGKRYLIINFMQVPYINSMGIAVLIRIVRSLAKAGCQTFAYGVTAHYQKLFRMVGLTEFMAVYPDEYSISQRIEAMQENG